MLDPTRFVTTPKPGKTLPHFLTRQALEAVFRFARTYGGAASLNASATLRFWPSWRSRAAALARCYGSRWMMSIVRRWAILAIRSGMLGNVLYDRDDLTGGRRACELAEKLFRGLRDADGLAVALNNLANLALEERKWSRADHLLKRARHYAQLANSTSVVSVIRGTQAESIYRRAVERKRSGRPLSAIHEQLREADEHLAEAAAKERRPRARAHLMTQRALLTAIMHGVEPALRELASAAQGNRSF
ncbi:MAG: hypothetical protein JWO97_1614 [Acidobacteria bacterium]|nr:hypothetical protein [Acidobacteriota bacterium]